MQYHKNTIESHISFNGFNVFPYAGQQPISSEWKNRTVSSLVGLVTLLPLGLGFPKLQHLRCMTMSLDLRANGIHKSTSSFRSIDLKEYRYVFFKKVQSNIKTLQYLLDISLFSN